MNRPARKNRNKSRIKNKIHRANRRAWREGSDLNYRTTRQLSNDR